MSPIVSGGGSGGSQLQTATAIVSTNPNTFVGSHVFNLGVGAHPLYVTMTITALNADGETWGLGPGNIQVLQDSDPSYQVSFDNVSFNGRSSMASLEPEGTSVGVVQQGVVLVPRYIQVTLAILDDTFALYSGPNHPTATVRFDLSYS